MLYISFNPAYNSIRYWTRDTAEAARLAKETGAVATPFFATPALLASQAKVVRDLIELARRVNQALDDSEEQEGGHGRQHAISGQDFDDVCEALHWLEELPNDKPGETMGPGSKAEWALRDVLESDGGIEAELQALRKKVATYEARDALGLVPPPAHPDDAAVDRFAAAMKDKLREKRGENLDDWEDAAACTNAKLARMLVRHIAKGDPVDVANLAMMLHQRNSMGIEPNDPGGRVPLRIALGDYVESDAQWNGMVPRWQALNPSELQDLTSMIWGAPCSAEVLASTITPVVRQLEALWVTNARPVDPATIFLRGECRDCGHSGHVLAFAAGDDDAPAKCPECGRGNITRDVAPLVGQYLPHPA